MKNRSIICTVYYLILYTWIFLFGFLFGGINVKSRQYQLWRELHLYNHIGSVCVSIRNLIQALVDIFLSKKFNSSIF